MEPRVAFWPENNRGRDFIIGDLHGAYEDLQALLDRVNFDPAADRVLSTGDLIDRGPQSLACLRLLRQPWFHAVIGNHEQLLIDAVAEPEGQRRQFHWLNGGDWAQELIDTSDEELLSLARVATGLPHIAVVGRGTPRRFNLVHGHLVATIDPLQLLTDAQIDAQRFPDLQHFTDLLIWARYLAFDAGIAAMSDAEPSYYPGLSLTYCGHNPVPHPVVVQSHCFVDTGSGYPGSVWVGETDSGLPMRLTMLERLPEGGHVVRLARTFER